MSDKPLAEKAATWERPLDPEREPAAPALNPPAAPELADEDLVLGGLDKDGHGSGTFIAAGDPIPPELARLPRRPARAAPRKK
jgi:hypothetical protein